MHDLDCKKCYMYCKKKLKITYRKKQYMYKKWKKPENWQSLIGKKINKKMHKKISICDEN